MVGCLSRGAGGYLDVNGDSAQSDCRCLGGGDFDDAECVGGRILESIRRYLTEVRCTLDALPLEHVQDVVDVLLSANYVGSTVFTLGNGGSASTASHFACDLAKGTIIPGRPRFRVVALTDNAQNLIPLGLQL